MPESPIYADFTMAAYTDNFYKWLTSMEMPYYADGNVEAPTGWFCIVHVDAADIATYTSEAGDPGVGKYLKDAGAYNLVQINNDGLIWAYSYKGLDGLRPDWHQHRRALADFNHLTRLYREWEDAYEAPHIEAKSLPWRQGR